MTPTSQTHSKRLPGQTRHGLAASAWFTALGETGLTWCARARQLIDEKVGRTSNDVPVSYMHSITYPDGWVLHVRAIYSQATYMGQREGPLTARVNDQVIRRMVRKAATLFGDTPVHLVEPSRTVGRVIEMQQLADGEPVRRETLPPVCCIGFFEADPVPGVDGCASGLLVVWFQGSPPPVPLEPELVDLFSGIEWDALAATYWY